ncbi:hypothetical protein O5182_26030, partial [Escherichia coli]|nr:hypothetical protein [Escherichia coli]
MATDLLKPGGYLRVSACMRELEGSDAGVLEDIKFIFFGSVFINVNVYYGITTSLVDLLISVGDNIDRGPESLDVLRLLN